jgi:hypothetical protein
VSTKKEMNGLVVIRNCFAVITAGMFHSLLFSSFDTAKIAKPRPTALLNFAQGKF